MNLCIIDVPENIDIDVFKRWLDTQVDIVNVFNKFGSEYSNIVKSCYVFKDVEEIKLIKGGDSIT